MRARPARTPNRAIVRAASQASKAADWLLAFASDDADQTNQVAPVCDRRVRDAAPDAWGRRVILNKKFGVKGNELDNLELSELTFLLESGSDRIGALDFQLSPSEYVPRSPTNATLEELMESAQRVEKGIPLSPELDQALHHGSSIGGARPKALIEDGAIKHVAKFSSSSDVYSVVKEAPRISVISGRLDVAHSGHSFMIEWRVSRVVCSR